MPELSWRKRWSTSPPEHAPVSPPAHPSYDLEKVVADALEEDAGDLGDVTSEATVPTATQGIATFLAKADGMLAGLAVADEVFRQVDRGLDVEWHGKDGDRVIKGTKFGIQRLAMVDAVAGTGAQVLCTRKTVPGLRLLDKWAVLIGGSPMHRIGLYDMVMIKDNHVAAAGGFRAALQGVQEYFRHRGVRLPVEVETGSLQDVKQVLDLRHQDPSLPIDRIMLDNMTKLDASAPGGIDVSLLRAAVQLVDGAIPTEASGNVTLQTVRQIAASGATYISCGALTHSVHALDISLKVCTETSGLSGDPRSGVKFVEHNIEQAAFERIFIAGQEQSGQTVLVSDSEEDEEQLNSEEDEEQPVCLEKQILLTSFQEVQDFAAFHDLTQPKIQQHGACRNSRVLKCSGEVAVLVPPLTAAWQSTVEGTSKTTVVFSWAVLNSAGMVHFGSSHPWGASAYHSELLAVDADPRLALTKQVVQHVHFLLANQGSAAGVAPLLHTDICKQRVLNFGLSRAYWGAGRPSECNPAWLAKYHPEALQAGQPDAEALVIDVPASDFTEQAVSAACKAQRLRAY
ncbi:hypothetical protein WJX74_010014 [Apatococcus lobatus]|uniref:nicotinate-nucleotide diphosphorylase (carboxylating) n=1 Tax=Apatococcus lobatus TaxID=904363 RepID=A0AAW1SGV3_9CHLO